MKAPDKLLEIKAWIAAGAAVLTSLWGYIGWAVAIFALCMLLDYITGTWAAKARGEWSSQAAREGLWHKLGEIVALLVAALCDIAIRVILATAAAPIFGELKYNNYFTLVVSFWYIFTEVGSILENAASLGAPVPEWLIKGVGKLKKKIDETKPLDSEVVRKE